MRSWSELYEDPVQLSTHWGHHRIFAPNAYRIVRQMQAVPVLHTEAIHLATWFPLCWARTDDGPVLVALRSLLDGGLGFTSESRKSSASLPMAFQAFPVAVPSPDDIASQVIAVDRVIADQPTDAGAPLIADNGKLSRAALMRAGTALTLGRILPSTLRLTRAIDEAGLLEPWPLKFPVPGAPDIVFDGLMVIAASRLDRGVMFNLIEQHGPTAGLFIAAQRISLFQIGKLLNSAKIAIANRLRAEKSVAKA
ncbi:SapC family protein [Bosea sp. PAMC 26642]|uniref:SapC family protein n=1 Tax=Bosea sp. (strain PAMC 26642) TaxID=1792307 RepID=UPI0007704E00|nr:SapC family protein [Bosea sp. PAMC 26642]AMJ61173.1 hypothetical protein AXW83_13490 [Bosea sp. PAMC 26642]